jgi:hypothetical protein
MADQQISPPDWNKWRCRCSAIGIIITEPKSAEDKKAGNLSATAKTYLKKCYVEAKYGRVEDFSSRYTDKGTLSQPDCLQLLSFLDEKPYKENKDQLGNEFLTGEPDFFDGPTIKEATYLIENKSAWSLHTFMANLGEKLDKSWEGQLQGYYDLVPTATGAEVSICLVNCPESIILEEKKRLLWKMDVVSEDSPEYKEACRVLEFQMKFDDIPHEQRRIKFPVTRDAEFIAAVYDRVKKCRRYLVEIESMHLNGRKPPAPAIDITQIPLIKIK